MKPSPLDWAIDGRDWPLREHSHFVEAGGLRWHVQRLGTGPVMVLLHGTGASSHSWRALMPRLAERFELIAPDLPGHAFSGRLPDAGMSLPGMARALTALMQALQRRPALIVGHSAGAAIALRMCLDELAAPSAVVSINGALLPFAGLPGWVFAPAARLLAAQSWVPELFARRAARPEVLARLLASTGSTLDDEGMALYRRLVTNPQHAAGALSMMANWDLGALQDDLPRLTTPLHMLVGTRDHTVSPRQSRSVQALVPTATRSELLGLGHLAHEAPERVALMIERIAASALPG